MNNREKGYDYHTLNSWSQNYSSIFNQITDATIDYFHSSQKDMFFSEDVQETILGHYKEIQEEYAEINKLIEEAGQYLEGISKDGIGKFWEGASSVKALDLHYLLREYLDNMEYLHELLMESMTQLQKGKEDLYSHSTSMLALKRMLG